MYRYIIFDVDDTLLDFESAFHEAQINIAKKLEIELSKEFKELDEKTGWQTWKQSVLNLLNSFLNIVFKNCRIF